ncbi:MAG: hypothetical protein ACOX1Q_01350 [Eubacteriales bacterium]
MKRLFALLLAVLMVLGLMACSDSNNNVSPTDEGGNATDPSSTPVAGQR